MYSENLEILSIRFCACYFTKFTAVLNVSWACDAKLFAVSWIVWTALLTVLFVVSKALFTELDIVLAVFDRTD